MERIVLGYDGSDAADSALDWVAARVSLTAARVEVVTVSADSRGAVARAEVDLDNAERRLRVQNPESPVETCRVSGSMPRTLATSTDRADLLVIGINRGHPIRAALRGWMPLRVSAAATAPTCIVPRGWAGSDGPITVGVADDSSSDTALIFAAREAMAAGTPLHLVHGWHAPEHPQQSLAQRGDHTQHCAMLSAAAERIKSEYPRVTLETELVEADPVSALAQRSAHSALIVIGTHRRGIFEGGLVGSVSQELLWRVPTPICIVPEVGN